MRMKLRICCRTVFIIVFVLSWASICQSSNYGISVDEMTAEEVKNELNWDNTQLAGLIDVSVCESYTIGDEGGFQRWAGGNMYGWFYFQAAEALPQLEIGHKENGESLMVIVASYGDAYNNVTGVSTNPEGSIISSPSPEILLFYGSNISEDDYVRLGIDYTQFGSPTNITFHATPIPGAVWLLGSGLIGIVGIRRKFKK